MRIRRVVEVASVFIMSACHPSLPIEDASTWAKRYSAEGFRRELHLSTPDLLAVGDTAALLVDRYRCHSDVCGSEIGTASDRWTWKVEQAAIASIDGQQRMIARHVGETWVAASKGDTLLRRHLRVLPPVATISWEPAVVAAHVGDTLHLRAIARDSSGRRVGELRLQSRLGGERSANANILSWGGPKGIVIAVNGPGFLELRTSLGRRTAVFRTTLTPR